jgi:spermidine synthase
MAGAAAGVVVAGFFLLPSYRVPTVLAMLAGTLAIAAFLSIGPGFRKRAAVVALAIVTGGFFLASPKPRPKELLVAKSDDGRDLRVVSHEGSRYLFVDQALQSTVNAQGRTEEKYLYFLASRLILARPQMKSAALVGLGGAGVIPLLREHHVDVDCVDPSAHALELARAHLGLSLPDSQVHAVEGRFFLQSHPARFDSVILDVFTGERPTVTLATVEGLTAAKTALARGGILALNTWAFDQDRRVPNPAGAAIYASLWQVFSQVLAVPTSENLLFFASDLPIQPQRSSALLTAFDVPRHFTWLPVPALSWPAAPVLTDESNPLGTLEIAALESLRQSLRTCYPPSVRDALVWE